MPSQKIKESSASLLKRIISTPSSVRDLNIHFLSMYIAKDKLIPGTLVHRLVSCGLSPTYCAFNNIRKQTWCNSSGIVDSLRSLIMHTNFIKPYSEQHVLSSLLIRSF